MGKALVDEITEDFEKKLENVLETDSDMDEDNQSNNVLQGKKVLLLTSNSVRMGSVLAGEKIKELMQAQGIAAVKNGVVSPEEDSGLLESKKADIVIALDDVSLQIAAKELASETENRPNLYGIGISADNVYYLERGVIRSMLVVNDFKMGYKSLSLLADAIRTNNSEQQRADIEFQAVRPEEVHNPEIEKLLFPLVQ